MPTNYVIASWCYIISALLDAFDGYAARSLNQSKLQIFCCIMTITFLKMIAELNDAILFFIRYCLSHCCPHCHFALSADESIKILWLPIMQQSMSYVSGTKFGAILDQLTDRCGTMGLLVMLSHFYPKYLFWFQLSMVIDIACHWIYLHS